MALDLPVAGEKPWDVKLNAALNDLDYRLENTQGVPAGGATDEVLVKASGADYDAVWATVTGAGLVPDASTTTKGIVELATSAETTTGTDTVRATTPAGVKAVADTKAALTHTHAAAEITSDYVGVNVQTGTTYTIVLTDRGKLVTLNNSGAITVTLPQDSSVAIAVGDRIDFIGLGTGLITFVAGTGATANATPSLVTRARYSAATAIKVAANTWIVVGDMA